MDNANGIKFKSCFAEHTKSEYGKHFTVDFAKKMCYEDARLLPYLLTSEQYFEWLETVKRFCKGDLELYDCLVWMSGCYLDYIKHSIDKKAAAELMKGMEEKLEEVLSSERKAKKAQPEVKPFVSDGRNSRENFGGVKIIRID